MSEGTGAPTPISQPKVFSLSQVEQIEADRFALGEVWEEGSGNSEV